MTDRHYERLNEAVLSRLLLETKQSAAVAVERATELLAEREAEIEQLQAALAWAAGNLMFGDNKRFAELFPAFSDLVELPQTGDSND